MNAAAENPAQHVPVALPPADGLTTAVALTVVGGVLVARLHSYLLFHLLAELVSIIVAVAVFLFAWSSRRVVANNFLLVVGVSSLVVAGIDLLHALTYKGMAVLPGYDANLPTQLWLAARSLQAAALLVALWSLQRPAWRGEGVVLGAVLGGALLVAGVFAGVFPDAYREGAGLTRFKVVCEYGIILLLLEGMRRLRQVRHRFEPRVQLLLVLAILSTVASELAFTFYAGVYDWLNLLGHLLKVGAFWLLYLAIVDAGLVSPVSVLLRDLRASEQRHRAMFLNSLDGVLLTAPDGRILAANPAATELFRSTEQDICRAGRGGLVDGTDPRVSAALDERERTGRLHSVLTHVRADGTRFDGEVTSMVFPDASGERRAWVLIRDVTERLRTEAERQRLTAELQRRAAELDAVIASIGVGVWIHDRDGRLVQRNPEAEAQGQLGLPADTPGAPGAEGVPALQHPVQEALRGQGTRGQVVSVKDGQGSPRWSSVSAAPIRTADGTIHGAVLSSVDITALHRLQEQREDFIRAITHDLRSPLAVVMNCGQLLERVADSPERVQGAALRIGVASRRMRDMLSDLADSARLEAGQLRVYPEPVDLVATVGALREHLAEPGAATRVQLATEAAATRAQADPAALERILINLVGNALKYSPVEQPVTVRLERQEARVVVSVQDHGAGIAPEELPGLFQRYYRTHSGRGRRDSLGLGLYITRGLVEAHGGRIWAESTPGMGSTFCFTLSAE